MDTWHLHTGAGIPVDDVPDPYPLHERLTQMFLSCLAVCERL